MIREHFSIHKVFDMEKWEKLQDSLAAATKLAILTVDYKGIPVTSHSGCQSFCHKVRQDSELLPFCQKCDSRGGLEAARSNAPYIYLCHYNIVDIAVPIIIDDKYIGAVMAGQVRLSDPASASELEQILSSKNQKLYSAKWEELKDHYADLPTMTLKEIQTVSNMLSLLCNYIVEEAMNKNLVVEMFDKASAAHDVPRLSDIVPGYSLKNIENLKKEMSNVLAHAYVNATREEEVSCRNPVLKPAFDYIFTHKNEAISLQTLADLCHISPSYFSKLFAKETGENFSNYIARLKIKWAKQLLEETQIPVSEISTELGFNEPGYFIKTFKKYEGTTPAVYRRYYKD
ncbi:YesN/AraC family two-component response regulator [Paenibacillus phyllosphaerae]|uniref:YesN/AraC family two-component response regulator n=1 Tax=Paenibacillus phyllosphaerae TaxID=274593 RepID=A0A7W5B0P1_9BACL|nr:PocR ligand-binding domain-containing protein [Paenibacillus phyllosphaerae]MBB3111751.1 YesN/AraC family two-component response regulator [Paenibacillus phyllosphaerae]